MFSIGIKSNYQPWSCSASGAVAARSSEIRRMFPSQAKPYLDSESKATPYPNSLKSAYCSYRSVRFKRMATQRLPYVHKLQISQHPRRYFCESVSGRDQIVSRTWHCRYGYSKAARLMDLGQYLKSIPMGNNLHFKNSCRSCQSTTALNLNSDREFCLSDAVFRSTSIYNIFERS